MRRYVVGLLVGFAIGLGVAWFGGRSRVAEPLPVSEMQPDGRSDSDVQNRHTKR